MDKLSEVCEYLKRNHTGKQNAVHSKELERRFSMTGRSLRRRIFKLRQDGHPICASEDGYYYAEKQSEINETVGWLDELVAKISNSREGLIQSRIEENKNLVRK